MLRRRQLIAPTVLVISLLIAVSCWKARPGLDEYCDDDPRAETCPEAAEACRPYECASYCIRHELVAADWAPASGMGSWCAELTVEEVCGICRRNGEVVGCVSFLAASCGAPDGDADGDADLDGDADGDVDEDGDADGDGDVDVGCDDNGDCLSPTSPRCDEGGACVGCEAPEDCTLQGSLDVCDLDSGSCVDCLENEHCGGDEPLCNGQTLECVECLTDRDCGFGDAPVVCSLSTGECVAGCLGCDDNMDCEENAGPGFYCVQYDVTLPYVPTTHTYRNCLQGVPAGGTLDCERPYRLVGGIRTDSGADDETVEVDACLPPSTTSCTALRSLGRVCTEGLQCGEEPFDSAYPEWMCWGDLSGPDIICSYYCGVDREGVQTPSDELCPVGFYCSEDRNNYCMPDPA